MTNRTTWVGIFACLFALCLGLSSGGRAVAADGSSGCGPGWYVFKDTSLVSSSLRAVTNGILFPTSTLGMTFGTSNCAQHKIVDERDRESVKFAGLAYHDLLVQAATGHGEYLGAFAATLGCPWQVQGAFNQAVQNAYPLLFATDEVDPVDLVTRVRVELRRQPALASACNDHLG